VKIAHDHVDHLGRIKVTIFDGDFMTAFRLSVEDSDALAKSLLDEGIAWRAEEQR
jgi:hypothetical protein